MHELSILLLGQTNRTEFEQARIVLNSLGAVCEFCDVAAAATALAEAEIAPDVIVIAQAFPGQFSHQAIERMRRLAPLARMVGLMGSWCEGEMRTGTPWPGVVRTYWHQWSTRCSRELRRLANERNCSWALPPTATDEERLQATIGESWPRREGLVVLRARSHEAASWLSAACGSRGFATVWQRTSGNARIEGATAGIVDVGDLCEEECKELRDLAASLRPAPVIAILAFPRAEDRRRALSAGAASVLSKPLAIDDLFWELDNVAGALSNVF
jgi:hypothetical protein